MTIKACNKCGSTDLYKDGRCKSCQKKRNDAHRATHVVEIKAYYKMNKEAINASGAAHYAANRTSVLKRNAAYYAANKEKINARSAGHYITHKKEKKAYAAAYYAANKEKFKAQKEAWYAANPDARTRYNQNRRAKRALSAGTLSSGLVELLFGLQKGKCPCCRQPLGNDFHLDHKMPLFLGGTNTDDNMQLLRKKCNLEKYTMHPIDFMQSKGFLL